MRPGLVVPECPPEQVRKPAFWAWRNPLRAAPGVREEGRKAAKALVAGCHLWEEGCSKDSDIIQISPMSQGGLRLPRTAPGPGA